MSTSCKECGYPLNGTETFCPECGCPVEDKNLSCPECGAVVRGSENFCSECGYPLNPSQKEDFGVVEEDCRKGSKKLWMIITLIIICLCGCAVMVWLIVGNRNNDNVKISNEFIEAVHQYDELFPFSEGVAAVKKDGKIGYINTKGELIIPCKFSFAGPFKEGLACVVEDYEKTISFIDKKGHIHQTKYLFSTGLYGGTQMINSYISPDLESLYFNNGFCKINYEKDDEADFLTVYIDKDFNEVSKPKNINDPNSHSSEYTIFTEKGKDVYGDEIEFKGLKKNTGEIIIPAKYNNLQLGDNGVVLATLFIESADSHFRPTVPEGKTMYGYLDYEGNSTFTEVDLARIEEYKNAQLSLYQNLQKQEEEQLQREEEERLDSTSFNEYEETNSSDINDSYTVSTSYYDRSSGYDNQANNNNNNNNRYNKSTYFQMPSDVYIYLSDKTFKGESLEGARLSIRIKTNCVYANGASITAAPRITNVSPTTAIIKAYCAYLGGKDLTLYLDAQSGTITLDSGEKLYLSQ